VQSGLSTEHRESTGKDNCKRSGVLSECISLLMSTVEDY
jgi:hypothetical protein